MQQCCLYYKAVPCHCRGRQRSRGGSWRTCCCGPARASGLPPSKPSAGVPSAIRASEPGMPSTHAVYGSVMPMSVSWKMSAGCLKICLCLTETTCQHPGTEVKQDQSPSCLSQVGLRQGPIFNGLWRDYQLGHQTHTPAFLSIRDKDGAQLATNHINI